MNQGSQNGRRGGAGGQEASRERWNRVDVDLIVWHGKHVPKAASDNAKTSLEEGIKFRPLVNRTGKETERFDSSWDAMTAKQSRSPVIADQTPFLVYPRNKLGTRRASVFEQRKHSLVGCNLERKRVLTLSQGQPPTRIYPNLNTLFSLSCRVVPHLFLRSHSNS